MDDYRTGKDIFLHEAYHDASKFVSSEFDDVELADIVVDDPSKKMWHCPDVFKSNMLQHAIIEACNNAYGSTSTSVSSFLKVHHSSNLNNQFSSWVLFHCSPLNPQTMWLHSSCICFSSTSMIMQRFYHD